MERAHHLLHDHRRAFRVAIVLWVLGGLLFIVMAVPTLRDRVQTIDDWAWELVVRLEWDPAVAVAKILDVVGSAWVNVPLRIAVTLWLAFKRRWEAMVFWIVAAAISEPLIGLTKFLYDRPRPPEAFVSTTHSSFPSGHAVAGAVIAISLVIVLAPAGAARRNLELLAAAYAVAMGLSRVYLRAHWLTDAVAGVALGAAIAIGTAALVHHVTERRAERRTVSESEP